MIILYYLQKPAYPTLKTVALACYEGDSRINAKNKSIYFYLQGQGYQLAELSKYQEIMATYEIIKELTNPNYDISNLIPGLFTQDLMAECQKYINKTNLVEFSYALYELQGSSLTYPLGRILFEDALKKGEFLDL